MAALNAQQIANLLYQQGVPKEKIPTMTAISLGESSGRPDAFNPNAQTGDRSYGLFQINMLGGLGPERLRRFGLKNEKELFDPATNARVAKGILESQGLGAWSVYNSGQYKQFLPEAQRATESLGQATQPQQQPQTGGRTFNIYVNDPEDLNSSTLGFLGNWVQKLQGKTQSKDELFQGLLQTAMNPKVPNYFGDEA